MVSAAGGAFRAARILAMFAMLLGALLAWPSSGSSQDGPAAPVLRIEGAIGPATADYVTRGLVRANAERAPFVVLQMNTPGGLDSSMRAIIQEILRSDAPVVTYVSPSGGRAASAGTFILYASHIAAMAPGTNVGAATPVQLGGGGGPLSPADKADPKSGSGTEKEGASGGASDAKALNDAIAYIRALAEMRGRNVGWAEAAVRDAASLSAQAALAQQVIDVVAKDRADLLAQIDGRQSVVADGRTVTIDTGNLRLVDVEPSWRTKLLGAITDPNVALILMMVGVYGLLFEFMSPGALYPGTIGAICLLIGLYALTALPVNYAGVALIVLGIALMVGEAFSPSFGILGIGGVIAFALGALILFETDIPQFRISWPVLVALAVASLLATLLIVRLALTSRRRKVVSGSEQMIGAGGTVLDWQQDRGHVFVQGERWRARGAVGMNVGAPVRVTDRDGLVLGVEPDRQAAYDGSAPPDLREI